MLVYPHDSEVNERRKVIIYEAKDKAREVYVETKWERSGNKIWNDAIRTRNKIIETAKWIEKFSEMLASKTLSKEQTADAMEKLKHAHAVDVKEREKLILLEAEIKALLNQDITNQELAIKKSTIVVTAENKIEKGVAGMIRAPNNPVAAQKYTRTNPPPARHNGLRQRLSRFRGRRGPRFPSANPYPQ